MLLRPSPHVTFFFAFLTVYILTFLHFRRTSSWRDPSSAFFDPSRAFEREYSIVRETQARDFIRSVNISTHNDDAESSEIVKAGTSPRFCVGIPTVQRDGVRYFSNLIGSLLDGIYDVSNDGLLTPKSEATRLAREDLYLLPFIVSTDPTRHAAYHESWLHMLTDKVLTYDAADKEYEVLTLLEKTDTAHNRKPVLDYIHLLDACLEQTSAPYIVILEDDVVASKGWYWYMTDAVRRLERKGRAELSRTVYLRMFYNERILGWNSEEWKSYLFYSVLVTVAAATGLCVLRTVNAASARFLTPKTIFAILFVCVPASIGLYFALGRLTVAPLRAGINRMDTFGCCSQAFLFPREQILPLIDFYRAQAPGYIDMYTEQYANQKRLSRWAVTPSPFQHIGFRSSKGESVGRWGKTNTQNIFNWSFERFVEKDKGLDS